MLLPVALLGTQDSEEEEEEKKEAEGIAGVWRVRRVAGSCQGVARGGLELFLPWRPPVSCPHKPFGEYSAARGAFLLVGARRRNLVISVFLQRGGTPTFQDRLVEERVLLSYQGDVPFRRRCASYEEHFLSECTSHQEKSMSGDEPKIEEVDEERGIEL